MNSKATNLDRYWFLDYVAGWRAAFLEGLELTSLDGNLVLDALPGSATLLLDPTLQAAEFKCPSALCSDGCGNLLVVDAALNLIKRIDLERGSVRTLPEIGGKGVAPRELYEPRGIAVLPNGAVVVSDTGNHHLKIFSPDVGALLQDWGAYDALGQPRHGTGGKMFRFPWSVAVGGCQSVYVVDRGNRRVQRIRADGVWEDEFSQNDWESPTRLAIGPNGLIAVVDSGANTVTVIGAGFSQELVGVDKPRSVAIDPQARVYVGDADGLMHLFVPDPNTSRSYELAGTGMTGFDGGIIDLVSDSKKGLLAIVAETSDGPQQRLWQINPNGAPVHTGTFISHPLDSNIPNCQWHRVLLNASVPAGTSIQIDSFTAEAPLDPASQITDPFFNQWKLCIKAGNQNPDCLVQSGSGRYLWLRLTFHSNGLVSPELRSLKVSYPRVSYLQYLPAVYQEDEKSRPFLERFLSIFQTEFDGFDRKIDRIWQLFNPGSIPAKDLKWLASWLAVIVDPGWSESKLRSMLKKAFQAQCQRGTVAGLVQAIQDYVGVQAVVVEHFQLRQLPILPGDAAVNGSSGDSVVAASAGSRQYGIRLWGSNFYKRLQLGSNSQIGDFQLISDPAPDVETATWDAHQFTVLFLASPYGSGDVERQISQVVEREKPVHTQANICQLLPRFRIGVQSTIGTDSVVGGISYLVLNQLATLGYDSILGCSKEELQLRQNGIAPHPRVGLSSQLS
jgi:phage tail-like protein